MFYTDRIPYGRGAARAGSGCGGNAGEFQDVQVSSTAQGARLSATGTIWGTEAPKSKPDW